MGSFFSKKENADGERVEQSSIEISQKEICFGKKCTIGKVYKEKFQMINHANRKVEFHIEPVVPKGVVIHFEPPVGHLTPGKPFTVTGTLQMSSLVNLDVKVSIEFDGRSFSKFIDISARCESGVFGCDPLKLELVPDLGHMVPKIIVEMRLKLEQLQAKHAEGIFRLAGDVLDVQLLKDCANASSTLVDSKVNDVHAYASLLKIWFRELPTPVLNKIPSETIKNIEDKEAVVEACLNLSEPERTLLLWITDLLVDYVSYESITKMTPQNLAIVVAPNLYNPGSPNPLEAMMLLQKGVSFFLIFLQDRIERHPHGVSNNIIIEEHKEIDDDEDNNKVIEENNENKSQNYDNEDIIDLEEMKKEKKKKKSSKKREYSDDESKSARKIKSNDTNNNENIEPKSSQKKEKKRAHDQSNNDDHHSSEENNDTKINKDSKDEEEDGEEVILVVSPKKKKKKKNTE